MFDGASRNRQVRGSTIRNIGTRVAFMVKIGATRRAAEKVGFPTQHYTVLGRCARNFDSCLCVGSPPRLLEEALQMLCTECPGSQDENTVGSSVWHGEPLFVAAGGGTALVSGHETSWTQFTNRNPVAS